MMITQAQLRRWGACEADRATLKELFGQQARLTRRTLVKAEAAGVDALFFLLHLAKFSTVRHTLHVLKLDDKTDDQCWDQRMAVRRRRDESWGEFVGRRQAAYTQAVADAWGLA